MGIGTGLIRDGLARFEGEGAAYTVVLGDPRYYGRSGYTAEQRVKPPYDLPQEWAPAWQGRRLNRAAPEDVLMVPKPWRNAAYWSD